jgi:hypothetical protein
MLHNGVSCPTREGIGLEVQAVWLSRTTDLLFPLRWRNIVCFEQLVNTSVRTEERTFNVTPKSGLKREH